VVYTVALATDPSREFQYFAAMKLSRVGTSAIHRLWNRLEGSGILQLWNRQEFELML